MSRRSDVLRGTFWAFVLYDVAEQILLDKLRDIHGPAPAARLNAMRLDITELTERMDNAIKFLSDVFYAQRVLAGTFFYS